MKSILLLVAVLLPILGSILIPLLPFGKRQIRLYIEAMQIITSILVWSMIIKGVPELTIIGGVKYPAISLRLDGIGMVFAGLISALWPAATLYSFEYMEHEERKRPFFLFYTMTYGITLGISFAGNLLTMYFFYEMLTLVTIPLVIHTFTREAVLATKKYIYYSIGGAALGFLAVVFMLKYGEAGFRMGGALGSGLPGINVCLTVFVLAFLGFSVKAAMFPFHSWIPDAGVAPTPVTALLHAVAVVKAGAFAVIRLTYYCFGTEMLRGTWAQSLVMALAAFTIVFGCSMAVKETHMKRRLAFSTVANLSYIIFGATLMSSYGLAAGLSHLVFHAVMKIASFFCVGAVMHMSGKSFVYETDGFGKKMPWVYGIFTVSTLGMMGVPGTAGFVSKFYLAMAALQEGSVLSVTGIVCLLISAMLTAVYMMTMVIRAFFPDRDFDMDEIADLRDPSWRMIIPLLLFTAATIYFGLHSGPLLDFLTEVSQGLL